MLINSDGPIAFLVCLPLSRCPTGIPRIPAKCVLCGGEVGINPNNSFGTLPVADLKPLCGACMVDLNDADSEESGPSLENAIISKNLSEDVKDYTKILLANGGEVLLKQIRLHKAEYKADNPKGGN